MIDPEKLYLLCQCLDEMLLFVRTFELTARRTKPNLFNTSTKNLVRNCRCTCSANPNCSGGRIALGRAAYITDCPILDT